MNRKLSSCRWVLWTTTIGVVACTGYLNDSLNGQGGNQEETYEGVGGESSSMSRAGEKGGGGGSAGRVGAAGQAGKTSGETKTGNAGNADTAGNSGEGGDETGGADPGHAGNANRAGGDSRGGNGGGGSPGGKAGASGKPSVGGNATPSQGGSTAAGGSTSPHSGGSTGVGGSTNAGGSGAGGTSYGITLTPVSGGKSGFMTRYWDCCKPSCSWSGKGLSQPLESCDQGGKSTGSNDNPSACSGGSSFMCMGYSPWEVSSSVSYGFAAINTDCGKCFQVDFTGHSHNSNDDPGSQSLAGKHMIVQAINTGNIAGEQIDLLVPGGGVGDFDACSRQWGSSDLGERYGGLFLACQKSNDFDYNASKSCLQQKCQSLFGSKPDLLAGCNWFLNWFGAPDNPAMTFKEVSCPAEITNKSRIHR